MAPDADPGSAVRRIIRKDRWRTRLMVLAPVVAFAVLVGAVVDRVLDDGWRDISFHPRQTEDSPPSMLIDGGECSLQLRATVTETEDVVFIRLEQKGTSDDGCGNGMRVELDDPVGERDVIDESAGQRWGRAIDPDKPRKWVRVDD